MSVALEGCENSTLSASIIALRLCREFWRHSARLRQALRRIAYFGDLSHPDSAVICGHASCDDWLPKTIRVDQSSEFVSRDLDLWAYTEGVRLVFSRPGEPTDNAYMGAFNGRGRAECLNALWFLTHADAAEKMEDWRRYCYEVRPHGAIGHKMPTLLLDPDGAASQRS